MNSSPSKCHSSSVYEGYVVHNRIKPKKHKLKYNVFCLLVDLDELNLLQKKIFGFGYNTFSIMSFYDKDYGIGEEVPLRTWIEKVIRDNKVRHRVGKIKLLCYPRIMGYIFNPICNYFCYDEEEVLIAIIHEVSNTFGEKHFYFCEVASKNNNFIRHEAKKCFYVSPFIKMNMDYSFKVKAPDDRVEISINETDENGPLLFASFKGKNKKLTKWTILKLFLSYPLMTLKVIAGIHWEALKIWSKGIPLVKKPAPQSNLVTLTKIKNYN